MNVVSSRPTNILVSCTLLHPFLGSFSWVMTIIGSLHKKGKSDLYCSTSGCNWDLLKFKNARRANKCTVVPWTNAVQCRQVYEYELRGRTTVVEWGHWPKCSRISGNAFDNAHFSVDTVVTSKRVSIKYCQNWTIYFTVAAIYSSDKTCRDMTKIF
jgi:hypothetical protein